MVQYASDHTIFRPGLAYSRTTYLGVSSYMFFTIHVILRDVLYLVLLSQPGQHYQVYTDTYAAFFVEFLKDTAVLHTRALQAKIGKYFTVLHSPKVKIRIRQNFFIIPLVAPFKLEKSKVNTKLHFFGYYSTVQILRRRRRRKIRQISIG